MRSRLLRAFRDDWRLTAAAFLGLGVLAALVTVVAVLMTRPAADPADEAPPPAAPAEADIGPALPEIGVEDFVVPNEGERLENWRWQRYRTPGEPWDPEQVERFWQDPREPALEYLRTRNNEEIERIFQNVP